MKHESLILILIVFLIVLLIGNCIQGDSDKAHKVKSLQRLVVKL